MLNFVQSPLLKNHLEHYLEPSSVFPLPLCCSVSFFCTFSVSRKYSKLVKCLSRWVTWVEKVFWKQKIKLKYIVWVCHTFYAPLENVSFNSSRLKSFTLFKFSQIFLNFFSRRLTMFKSLKNLLSNRIRLA